MSPLFGDNMVFQRGKTTVLWGWSEPGDKVSIEIGAATASTVAGPDHRWQVKIQPPAVGGPYTVKIAGHETVELHNVMVGDVWLCGGQSNMGLPLRFALNGADEAKAANYPDIRFFTVATRVAYRPTDLLEGKWSVVSRKRQTTFQPSPTTSRARSSRRRISQSASFWITLVELPQRRGQAPTLCVR